MSDQQQQLQLQKEQNNPQAGAGRPLPKKEADAFRGVVKFYEMKQYKKAIKQADLVLKKFPNHGETLAMKGLTLNYMPNKQRDEAHAFVKQGLTNDFKSHVCWHVYGLLYRSDRNYGEAIKAYKQALRIDPGNLQILRDLSMLQIQMRDLDGFLVTRNTLLTLKSNAKINWMAFALAKHLSGDLRGAIKVIDTYLGTLTEESEELGRCFESSELALYKNSILAEIPQNHKEALDHLGVCEGIVVDRGAWLMARATYQLRLRDCVGARQSVMALFERGMTEDHRVHSMFMCVLLELDDDGLIDEALRLRGTQTVATLMPLTPEQKKLIRDAYEAELVPRFPTSHAVQRVPMTLLESDGDLIEALDIRCRRDLQKGVPSLASELQSYIWIEKDGRFVRPDDPVDYRRHPLYLLIVERVDSYVSCLLSDSKFAPGDEKEETSPSTILWAWYLRAGLHELAGEYTEGIAVLDKCIEHTPTAVDVYELKARLLKAAGDIKGAVECLDKGRELDRQDRYVNNQTTRYMLQAGMDEQALKTISLFAKHEGNPEQNLFDMQCSWYELEVAACFERKQDLGRSLKKYAAVAKHFDDINEDQFDFHGYCLRKVTLRSYVDVLRFEDEAYGEEYFCEAAEGIIRIYLQLFDHPLVDESTEPDYSTMTAAERKKAKAIARKKKKAAEKKEADAKEAEANKQAENGSATGTKPTNNKGGKAVFVDPDPLGKELLKKDALEEATKYSAMLTRYAPKKLKTWLLRYDVAIRRKKPLMALQALRKARRIDPSSPELFLRSIAFAAGKTDASNLPDLPDPVRTVLAEETPALLDLKSVADCAKDRAAAIRADPATSLPVRVAVAKALVDTNKEAVAEACALILANHNNSSNGGGNGGLDSMRGVTVDACRDALVALRSFGSGADAASDRWIAAVKGRFPLLSSSATGFD